MSIGATSCGRFNIAVKGDSRRTRSAVSPEAFIKESMSSIPVSAGRSCHAASMPFFAPERNAP